MEPIATPPAARLTLLYHYGRTLLPTIALEREAFDAHLVRTFATYAAKLAEPLTWPAYLDALYFPDWLVCIGCLTGLEPAWELLFAARTGRSDCLLVDALRARASRLYPRNEERQETAVTEFWSGLLVPETEGTRPTLARYDGQRPLTPWLIRVFQNLHLSRLRQSSGVQALPDDDIALPLPAPSQEHVRWHQAFIAAANEWLDGTSEQERLLLGLRWRYKMSQRDIAGLLGIHEGTISRQTDKLRDHALEVIGTRLVNDGWTGDDLAGFVLTELGGVLTDVSAGRLPICAKLRR